MEVEISKEFEWINEKAEMEFVEKNSQILQLSPKLIEILYGRGLKSTTAIEQYLSPDQANLHDPFLLDDMEPAVIRIGQAIRGQELVWIFGDTDVDGFSSSAY